MFKFFKIFILFSIVFGCSQNETTTINPCSTSSSDIIPSPDDVELSFEAIRAFKKMNANNNTVNGLLSNFVTTEADRTTIINKLTEEKQKYSSLGFDNYVNDFYIKNKISLDFKNYSIQLKNNLTTHFSTNPNLTAFINFIGTEKEIINNASLCPSDKQGLIKILNGLHGFGQFYYNHYYSATSTRDCSFWTSILCKSLAFLAVDMYMRATTLPVHYPAEVVIKAKLKDNYPLGLSTASAIKETFNDVYNWCCNKDEIPLCADPTGSMILTHACNDFTYTVIGPGNYTTTSWSNDNTNPASAVTPSPFLRLSVPNLSLSSTMSASILCNGVSNVAWSDQAAFNTSANTAPPLIQWGQSPPDNASKGPIYNISATSGTSGQYVLSFSVTPFGGIVTSTGQWSGNLIFFASGSKIVTATLTNLCTGVSSSGSKTVFVN